jgi:hypothetical protein
MLQLPNSKQKDQVNTVHKAWMYSLFFQLAVSQVKSNVYFMYHGHWANTSLMNHTNQSSVYTLSLWKIW